MSEPIQPPTPVSPPQPHHVGQLVTRHHPELGPRQFVKIERDVTSLGDVRQKLLLHHAVRAVEQLAANVEKMSLVEARLQLARYEGKSGAKTVPQNGEPPHEEAGL